MEYVPDKRYTILYSPSGDAVSVPHSPDVLLAILKWYYNLPSENVQMPQAVAYVDVAEKESQFRDTSLREVVAALKIP